MSRFMSRYGLLGLGAATFIGIAAGLPHPRPLRAQAQEPAAPIAYVASVKKNTEGGFRIMFQPGRITTTGAPLRILIREAYGRIQDFQLVGAPGWVDSERYDIEARLEGSSDPTQLFPMLRQLLADRFNMKAHTETRELPIYALVHARDDKRLGAKLTPASPECAAMMQAGPRGRGARGDGRGAPAPDGRGAPGADGRGAVGLVGPAPPDARGRIGGPGPFPFDGPPPCGMRGGGFGQFRAGGTTMADLAASLSQFAQRIVLDKTGLTGYWDIQLSFAPNPGAQSLIPLPPGVEPPPTDPDAPTLFTAVQEQLGLKLESQRGPVEVVVVDSIERPTEN